MGQANASTIHTDVLLIGAGPAGIFCALGLLAQHPNCSITMIDQGLPVERRSCPKERIGHCIHCEPCRITSGFSGAGAFSDGKLSLSHEVGGDLPELIGHQLVQDTISRVDKMYLDFGADSHVEGVGHPDEVAQIRRRAIKAGLKLVDCPIRHLGTERAQQLYARIEEHLRDAGVNLIYECTCDEVLIEDGICRGARVHGREYVREIMADHTVVATGRRGAAWLDEMCSVHGIEHSAGPCDLGVRVEVRNEIMEHVNNVLYEGKLVGYPNPFRNKVRTFCQNPGGYVSQENYDGGLAVVNGHSYKDRKSDNTNVAVLATFNFREPFDQPIVYAQMVGRMCNMLGAGHILVQRFGDILDGKRTWPRELSFSNLVPTLPDAEAGDITAAIPYRAMIEIVNCIKAVDEVVPGFAAEETLLYAPELKFYSNRVKMDEHFHTSVAQLRCLGDSSGWTRGLMMASVMGLLCGESLL
jgi:uncharacterized FAD-dependent dehydrogenase